MLAVSIQDALFDVFDHDTHIISLFSLSLQRSRNRKRKRWRNQSFLLQFKPLVQSRWLLLLLNLVHVQQALVDRRNGLVVPESENLLLRQRRVLTKRRVGNHGSKKIKLTNHPRSPLALAAATVLPTDGRVLPK